MNPRQTTQTGLPRSSRSLSRPALRQHGFIVTHTGYDVRPTVPS